LHKVFNNKKNLISINYFILFLHNKKTLKQKNSYEELKNMSLIFLR